MKFKELGLSDEALRAIADVGYETPTPIQEKAIPVVLQGRDLFGVAQTGTGKTASFTLPMIDILAAGQAKARMPRTLILEPTRELATQVAENFEDYGKYHKLSLALLIGGVRMDEQNRKVDRGVDVLIATPGRLLDHVDNGKLMLGGIKILVIDEADRMLDMGFMPDVERIVGQLPPLRQTLFFSATMPPEIKRLAQKFLQNPREVSVDPPAAPAESVDQYLVIVNSRDKRLALRNILREESVGQALIFCNRKRDVGVLARSLQRHGFGAAELHGDLAQAVRTDTLERFKKGDVALLVASDVAARGLDIQGLPHVFNFDVPSHAGDYIHRIGRTGRAGLSGRAITLAAPEDGRYVSAITNLIGKEIPRMPAPDLDTADLEESGRRQRSRHGRRGTGKSDGADAKHGKSRQKDRAPHKKSDARRDGADAKHGKSRQMDLKPHKKSGAKRDGAARPAQSESRTASPKKQPRTRDADRRDKDVVGLGDHVPAFLQKKPGRRRVAR